MTARFHKKDLAFPQRPRPPPTNPKTETTARHALGEHTGPANALVRVARGLSRARSATFPFDNAARLGYANLAVSNFYALREGWTRDEDRQTVHAPFRIAG